MEIIISSYLELQVLRSETGSGGELVYRLFTLIDCIRISISQYLSFEFAMLSYLKILLFLWKS